MLEGPDLGRGLGPLDASLDVDGDGIRVVKDVVGVFSGLDTPIRLLLGPRAVAGLEFGQGQSDWHAAGEGEEGSETHYHATLPPGFVLPC